MKPVIIFSLFLLVPVYSEYNAELVYKGTAIENDENIYISSKKALLKFKVYHANPEVNISCSINGYEVPFLEKVKHKTEEGLYDIQAIFEAEFDRLEPPTNNYDDGFQPDENELSDVTKPEEGNQLEETDQPEHAIPSTIQPDEDVKVTDKSSDESHSNESDERPGHGHHQGHGHHRGHTHRPSRGPPRTKRPGRGRPFKGTSKPKPGPHWGRPHRPPGGGQWGQPRPGGGCRGRPGTRRPGRGHSTVSPPDYHHTDVPFYGSGLVHDPIDANYQDEKSPDQNIVLCEVIESESSITIQATFIIQYATDKVVLQDESNVKDRVFINGEQRQLLCDANGAPEPQDFLIKRSHTGEGEIRDWDVVARQPSFIVKDTGTYVCEARNADFNGTALGDYIASEKLRFYNIDKEIGRVNQKLSDIYDAQLKHSALLTEILNKLEKHDDQVST